MGLGYVGLPLSLAILRQGFTVYGLDSDSHKTDVLRSGQSYLKHIQADDLGVFVSKGTFRPSSDYSLVEHLDAVIMCVPTPLGLHQEPDLSFVSDTVRDLLPYMHPGMLISLESTTYPGTTEEIIAEPINSQGYRIGEEIFVAYSPEREDPGNSDFLTHRIPKIIGGITPECLEVAAAMYECIVERVVRVSSTRTAEMTKLLENIYRAVNIGLVNEIKMVADSMGIDIWEVIRAASTKPFGYTPFYPGPGLGGHCIPIDPYYLTWKAKEYGIATRFVELAGETNRSMPGWVVQKATAALNQRGVVMSRARVLILGVSYKKNIDDIRESPAFEIIAQLLALGVHVDYADPHVPRLPPMRKHTFCMSSVEATPAVIAAYDCVVLVTDHDAFDFEMIGDVANCLVDTRGRYGPLSSRVVCA